MNDKTENADEQKLDAVGNWFGAKATTVAALKVLFAIGSAFIFTYFITLALPIATSAMMTGRGITLSVLEVSPDKACDGVSNIIYSGASNNELEIYRVFIDRLLTQKRELAAVPTDKMGTAAPADEQISIDKMIKQSFEKMQSLSNARQTTLDKVIEACVTPPKAPEIFSLKAIGFVLSMTLVVFLFVGAIVKMLTRRPSDAAFISPPAIPSYSPTNVQRLLRQAEQTFEVKGSEDIAAVLYRNAIIAGIASFPSKPGDDLSSKIEHLVRDQVLPGKLVEWQRPKQLLLSGIGHDGATVSRADLIKLRKFADIILKCLFAAPPTANP